MELTKAGSSGTPILSVCTIIVFDVIIIGSEYKVSRILLADRRARGVRMGFAHGFYRTHECRAI